MCGIAAVIGGEQEGASRLAAEMAEALGHRGPDGRGVAAVPGIPVAFAHRRLAILDLTDHAAQPMRDEESGTLLAFNGEIYNFVELRDELEACGHRFRSTGDTEVLLRAYLQWGEQCLPRLNGMFAFIVWDARRQVVFCARDRFGEKPFYYAQVGRRFFIASEPAALFRGLGVLPPFRDEAVARFLVYAHADFAPDCFYRGVAQLPGGCCMDLSLDGAKSVRRYWQLSTATEPSGRSLAENAEKLRAVLEDAVRIRLRSDVAVGSCLSGGLDSSCVVGLVATLRHGGSDLFAFHSQGDGRADESRFAAAAANHAGARLLTVRPTSQEFADDVVRLGRTQQEPFGGPSIYAQWRVMRLAAEHGVKVLLDGQGVDELMGGYLKFPLFYLRDLMRSGQWLKSAREFLGFARSFGRAYLGLPWWNYVRAMSRQRVWGMGWALRPDVLDAAVRDSPVLNGGSTLQERLLADVERLSLPALLRYEDRNSMRFGVETRLPYLDHRVAELLFSLPAGQKFHQGRTKAALRASCHDVLPDSVRKRRDKIGFALGDAEWLRLATGDILHDILSSDNCLVWSYLRPERVRSAVELLRAGKQARLNDAELMRIFSLEVVHREMRKHQRLPGS